MKALLVLSLAVCAWGATLRPRWSVTTTRTTKITTTTLRPGCYHDGTMYEHGSYFSIPGGQCHCSDGQAHCDLLPGCMGVFGFVPVGGVVSSGIDHCGCGFAYQCVLDGPPVFSMQQGCSSCSYDGNVYEEDSHFTDSMGHQCHCSCGQATCTSLDYDYTEANNATNDNNQADPDNIQTR
ncbi:uncharacterized protein LOC118403693 isoform X2 [Branchiostoma floridae]|uniref:Uncharacterized protein LOC118403693 isoform X2 n=1 Tax=Branchiostoma floridae TaxID=7739 RepID=A0A9J7KGV8_BRAFL|nr:uncharacterized protein LOC118403693 isoform X2 [Branchiostoma floridae]